jgi:hypothetical protein
MSLVFAGKWNPESMLQYQAENSTYYQGIAPSN